MSGVYHTGYTSGADPAALRALLAVAELPPPATGAHRSFRESMFVEEFVAGSASVPRRPRLARGEVNTRLRRGDGSPSAGILVEGVPP